MGTLLPCRLRRDYATAYPVRISITAPFDLGDVVGRIATRHRRSVPIVLRSGHFQGDVDDRPVSLTLTLDPAPTSEPPLRALSGCTPGEPQGPAVSVDELFDRGIPVPASGRVEAQLLWGAHCHSEHLPHVPEGRRFGSFEHQVCADAVGKESTAPHAGTLHVGGVSADFDSTTLLPIGSQELRFGEIVCLAGDYYAHLDADASTEFAAVWPPMNGLLGWLQGRDYRATTLDNDAPEHVAALLGVIDRDKQEKRGWFGEFATAAADSVREKYPARRYLALAALNFCHFVCPEPHPEHDDFAYWLYRRYHARALATAQVSVRRPNPRRGLLAALAIDAFGCHFLSDRFAGGHLRVPRRLLAERYGVLRGSLRMSLEMHNEDNRSGLWCREAGAARGSGPRVVWQAHGDGMLLREEGRHNLQQVREALRRSAAEVFAASRGTTLPPDQRVEAILPVPLAPGTRPSATDVCPDRQTFPGPRADPNPWPLYWFDTEGRALVRHGGPDRAGYRFCDGSDGQPRPAPMEVVR